MEVRYIVKGEGLRSIVLKACLSSDGNDPKEREGLMLQKRKEIPEEDSLR